MSKISEETKVEIITKFNNELITIKQLAVDYDTHRRRISEILKEVGISAKDKHHLHIRKYSLNENYFDSINTEDKAYFLGLLYADGCNRVSKTNVNIRLQEEDKDILEHFVKFIGSNRPLLFIERQSKNPKWKNQYNIIFNSKKLSNRLKDIGMFENKEFILTFPNEGILPVTLYKHFIRGYYDGDGSFSVYQITRKGKKQFRYEASVVSTENFCLKVKDIISDQFGMNSHITKRHKKRENSTRTLKISGKQMFRFLEWIYEDSTIFIKRKHDKYLEEISKLTEWPILKTINQHQ